MGDSDGFILYKFLSESGTQTNDRLPESRLVIAETGGGKGIGEVAFLWVILKAVKGDGCSQSTAGHIESCGHAALALLIET